MVVSLLALLFLAMSGRHSTTAALDALHYARSATSLVLPFNQRMLYSRAPSPPADLAAAVERAIPTSMDTTDGIVLGGLIYLTHGHLDAAHEAVQRLGTPDAVYTHALLHRLEGEHVGEANMRGWSNADYWNDQLGLHPLYPHIRTLVCTSDTLATLAAASPRAEAFRAKFLASDAAARPWEASAFLGLCIEGCRQQDVACVRFCEIVTLAEVRLLIEGCCARLQIT